MPRAERVNGDPVPLDLPARRQRRNAGADKGSDGPETAWDAPRWAIDRPPDTS